jgi:pyruvate dehydrogenase E1 component alpha subunit
VGDPESYRKADEVSEWKDKDPIPRFANALLSRGAVTQRDVDGLLATARKQVDDAVRFMMDSPWPTAASVTDFVYA